MTRTYFHIAVTIVLLSCSNGSKGPSDTGSEMSSTPDAVDAAGQDVRAHSETADDEDTDSAGADIAGEVVIPPPHTLWTSDSPPLEWADWVAEREWLTDVSTWAHLEEHGEEDLGFRHLPDFAVGNGEVFALLGYGPSMNTIHSTAGPYYHKGEGFFSDTTTRIHSGKDGQPFKWQKEWIGWVRGAPVVHTQAINQTINFSTIDVAPLNGGPGDAIRRMIVRFAFVHNRTDKTVKNLYLSVDCERPQESIGKKLVEYREERSRTIAAIDEPDVEVIDERLLVPIGDLEGGAERIILLAYVMDDDDKKKMDSINLLSHGMAEEIFHFTVTEWHINLDNTSVLVTPDVKVNDYLEGQKMVVLMQQAYNGSLHAMCEYTGAWLRDTAGPVRLLLKTGMHENVRGMLDYLWLAALAQGEVKNSNFGNYSAKDAQPEPDWDAKGVMGGRERAESPSYIPLMYYWYWKASDRNDFLFERMDMMRYALDKQEFHGDLLPFSTDETFRTAMAVAHNLDIDEQFADNFLSANSSFLWVAAAEAMADMFLEVFGEYQKEAADELQARADEVRAAAETTFMSENGYYHPYVYEDSLAPAPAPFEDVNTKPLWAGYYAPDSAKGMEQLGTVIEALGGDDGILVSPLPPDYKNVLGLPIEEGIHTGMSPGYYLSNLALTHHPLAEQAFNALELHATSSGTTPEYQALDDHLPLHLIYDEQGEVGDYTARFRPWEGGILAEAAWEYLVGNDCHGPNATLKLAPNLPNGWSWLEAKRLRCGQTRIRLRVERTDDQWTVQLTLMGGGDLEIRLTLPMEADGDPTIALNEDPWTGDVETLPWGNRVIHLEPFMLVGGLKRNVTLQP